MSNPINGPKLINRTRHDIGYVAFNAPDGLSVFMLDADDVVIVHNVKVRTVNEKSRLNRTSDDSQMPSDGEDGGD